MCVCGEYVGGEFYIGLFRASTRGVLTLYANSVRLITLNTKSAQEPEQRDHSPTAKTQD